MIHLQYIQYISKGILANKERKKSSLNVEASKSLCIEREMNRKTYAIREWKNHSRESVSFPLSSSLDTLSSLSVDSNSRVKKIKLT